MNYPVWYLPEVGGGLLIAVIAVLHVFVSHFAVGGGLYLIYCEKRGCGRITRRSWISPSTTPAFFCC
jgi:hypothetical protein